MYQLGYLFLNNGFGYFNFFVYDIYCLIMNEYLSYVKFVIFFYYYYGDENVDNFFFVGFEGIFNYQDLEIVMVLGVKFFESLREGFVCI